MNFKSTTFSFVKKTHIKNEIPTLTSFRFLTAFIVFLFHCKLHLNYEFGLDIIDKFIANGSVFMTGFFVLSGYVMCHAYLNKDFTKKKDVMDFYLKRFFRIYPAYFIATIAYFAFIPPYGEPYTSGEWMRIILNDLLLIQAFFPNMFLLGMNAITWSISVETFFYLSFPVILVIFINKPRILLLTSLLISTIISVNIICEIYSNHKSTEIFFTYYSNPIMRISEFMTGIAFYLLNKRSYLRNLPRILKNPSFVFLSIFILTTLELSKKEYGYMSFQLLFVPLFGLLIFNFHNIKFGPAKQSSIVNYLGKISYSFYLWQFFAIQYGKYLNENYTLNSWYVMLLVLFVNIAISSVSYHLIEERFRCYLTKNYKRKFSA